MYNYTSSILSINLVNNIYNYSFYYLILSFIQTQLYQQNLKFHYEY